MSCLGGNGIEALHLLFLAYPNFDYKHFIQHERPEQELIAKFLQPDSRVLELGAGHGSTAVLIDKILSNPQNHVVIDPSAGAIQRTTQNKEITNSQFHIIHGFLANDRTQQELLWPECKTVPNFSLDFCKSQIGGQDFDALIIDCEGAFLSITQDYPELLKNATIVIIEMDGDEQNKAETERALISNNYTLVHSQCHPYFGWSEWTDHRKSGYESLNPKYWHNGIGFHQVWIQFRN